MDARRTYWRVTRKFKSLDENRMSALTVIGILQKGTSRIDRPMSFLVASIIGSVKTAWSQTLGTD